MPSDRCLAWRHQQASACRLARNSSKLAASLWKVILHHGEGGRERKREREGERDSERKRKRERGWQREREGWRERKREGSGMSSCEKLLETRGIALEGASREYGTY